MKHVKICSIVFLLATLFFAACTQKNFSALEYVDPFICTEGDHGHWHPSALVPNGLVKLGPDSYPSSLTGDGDWAHSGYNYADDHVRGFSHFHSGSSGGTTIGDRAGYISILPYYGEIDLENPYLPIDKKTEKASPGVYSVSLQENKIDALLSADTHSGFHQYTFKEQGTAHILLYPGNWARTRNFKINVLSDTELNCELTYGQAKFYMHMVFNKPFEKFTAFKDQNKITSDFNGKNTAIVFDFAVKPGDKILIKSGMSSASMEGAMTNLEYEITDWKIQNTIKKAAKKWSYYLDRIRVDGSKRDMTIFYTALYHTYFLPVTTTDVDGTYPGHDIKNHKAVGYTHYDNYAFWDSFRTKYPLYSITAPKLMHDITLSIRDIYDQVDNYAPFPDSDHKPHNSPGLEPKGPNGYQPIRSCRNEHMLSIPTDAYFKGLVDVDMKTIYPGIRNEMTMQMPDKYEKYGYIPERPDQTNEYSYANWCVAQVAKAVGENKDYKKFSKRANYYKNVWDPSIKYFRAKAANGKWLDFPEDPRMNREKYTYEGSKWHWRWFVLHDVPGLIDLFGGKDYFVEQLDYFFNNDLYQAGNQPDIQTPYLFNPAGAPWLTQKWVRKILTEPFPQQYGTHQIFPEPIIDYIYKTTPDGYLIEMDDDYGCMAAWYVLSSMGLFQICVGDPVYQITAPIFDRVEIKLDPDFYKGKSMVIEANNLTKENIYIQSAMLNGKTYNKSHITHKDLVKGGTLVFEMGPEPNKKWGIAK